CAGVLAATVAIAFFAAWWGFDYLSARDKSKPSAFPLAKQERGRLPPEPRLEEIDRLEGKKGNMRPKELHAEHERILETYGWVDRPFRRLLRRQASHFGACLLPLPDAVQPGAQWAGRRLARGPAGHGGTVPGSDGELRRARKARTGRHQEGELRRELRTRRG